MLFRLYRTVGGNVTREEKTRLERLHLHITKEEEKKKKKSHIYPDSHCDITDSFVSSV